MRKVICFLVAFVELFVFTAPTFALSASDTRIFRTIPNIFYNPYENNCSSKGSTDGSNVTIIGDSITEITAAGQTVNGAKNPGNHNDTNDFEEYLPKAEIYAQWGKSFWTDGGDGGPGGKVILDDLAGSNSLRDVVVYALGTNNSSSLTYDMIETVIEEIGSKRSVVLMTMISGENRSLFSTNNALVNRAASAYSNVYIADWASAAGSSVAKYIDPEDPFHPSIHDGTKLFAETIYNAVTCALGKGKKTKRGKTCITGDGNFAKIVNYYAGNNTYGVVLSAEAIAGIIANFSHESGLSPFRNQGQFSSENGNMSDSNGYGIAQFTPRTKVLPTLRNDPRTADYYSTYYKAKYGGSTTNGIPAGVPDEVDTAWLEVELDFLTETEGNKTTVGQYRNKGGSMGLSYISDSNTIYEAMNNAKTAADAARIFMWIYERPADKAGQAPGRQSTAESILDEVKNLLAGGEPGECKDHDPDPNESGLTYEQAIKFAKNYGKYASETKAAIGESQWNFDIENCNCGSTDCTGKGGSNCVSMSKFFLNKFTSSTSSGNGYEIVDNMSNAAKISYPAVWSVFSTKSSSDNHTGIIVGKTKDGKFITINTSCSRDKWGEGNGLKSGRGSAYVELRSPSNIYGGVELKYGLPNSVNTEAILEYVEK